MNSAYIIDFNFVSCSADCHVLAQLHRLHHEITDSMKVLSSIHNNALFAKHGRRVVIKVCTDGKPKQAYLFEPQSITSSNFDSNWDLITVNNKDWDLHGVHCAMGFLNILRRQLGLWLGDVKAGRAYDGETHVDDEDAQITLDLLTSGHYTQWYTDKLAKLLASESMAVA
jgi:hypothetical protein